MKTFGDRQRFALAYALHPDPDAGGEPHVRASWGALEVWVCGRNLTAGQAPDGSSALQAEVPLVPIAAWIAEQWNPMLHEERLPACTRSVSAAAWRSEGLADLPEDEAALDVWLDARDAWWKRHGLGAALPDYRVPDLHIRRLDEDVELSWDDREWRSVPGGIRLLESPGACRLPATEAADVLFDWCTAVLDDLAQLPDATGFARATRARLEANACDTPALERLVWMAGQRLEAAAQSLCRLAGTTAEQMDETLAALLGGLRDVRERVTPATLPVMLFKSASPALSQRDLVELARLAGQHAPAARRLNELREPATVPSRPEAATVDGCERARALRRALGLSLDAALRGTIDLEAALLPDLGVTIRELNLDDRRVDGVAIASPDRGPTIAVNRSGRFSRTPWGRRMTLAHELCHLLHDMTPGGLVGIVSNPWAPSLVERRANAFAATLLMPREAIDRLLPREANRWEPEYLRRAMEELGVGRSSFTWQLHNLGLISASEREAWLEEL